jgi:protein disulfide-isomerase-like protein
MATMRSLLLALSCLWCAAATSAADGSPPPPPGPALLEMTSSNFDAAASEGNLLIAFTAPWCGHCRMLAPKLAEAATELAADKIATGKVNAMFYIGLAARFPVKGFPTIFFINKEREVYLYEGSRSKMEMVKFAKGGWEKAKKLDFWSSPFSAIGRTKGFILRAGDWASVVFHFCKAQGLSQIAAGVVTSLAIAVSILTVVFAVIYLFDSPPVPRQHAD